MKLHPNKISPLLSGIVTIMAVLLVILVVIFVKETYGQLRYSYQAEKRIGAVIRGRIIQINGKPSELPVLTAVRPHGAAEKAGVKEGDILVTTKTLGQLYSEFALLPKPYSVTIQVVDGGDGMPLEMRNQRLLVLDLQ